MALSLAITQVTDGVRRQVTGMHRRLNFLRVHANFVKNSSQLYFVRKRKRAKNIGRDVYQIIDILINMRLEEGTNSYYPLRYDPQNAAMQNTFVCPWLPKIMPLSGLITKYRGCLSLP